MSFSKGIDFDSDNDCVACGNVIENTEKSVKFRCFKTKLMFHLPCYELFLNELLKDKYTFSEKTLLAMDFDEKIEEIDMAEKMGFNDEIENILDLIGKDLLRSTFLMSFDELAYCPKVKEYTALKFCFKNICQFEQACKIEINIVPPDKRTQSNI